MIGIIGYGMVGKAVEYGFPNIHHIISDPQYNSTTIADICAVDPIAIFVSVPTPTDGTNYAVLRRVLQEIKDLNYRGLTVVKSTVLPQYIKEFDVIYNPEFLSRATSNQDFVNPPFVLIGGDRAKELLELYKQYSIVDTSKVFLTDIKTAALAKYTMNSFYAVKVTYMNAIYDIAQEMEVDYNTLIPILSSQPWMGSHHFQVPGPDGDRGFGGPCLPKDTAALANEYDVKLLKDVLELNSIYRENND
jgi:UDPglucose 6-dehydrogenase